MPAQILDGELVLYGFVGESLWTDGFTAGEVLTCLAELGHDGDITARINSPGGYLDDGVAIFNALKARKGKTTVVVDGVAASSASIIVMGGDERVMRTGALLMIHDPSTLGYGTVEDLQKVINQLEAGIGSMVSIYSERTGESAEETRAIMKAETWLDAEDAVKRGFATSSEATAAEPVAAFDYRVYAHAPEPLKALAAKNGWSLKAIGSKARASAPAEPGHPTEKNMTEKPKADPTSADAAKIAADTKARIKAITTCEEAKGREGLAEHIAFATEMSAEDAKAMLAASPKAEAKADDPDPAAVYEQERRQPTALAKPDASKKRPGAVDRSPLKAAVDRANARVKR
ncbi:ATP-dependent Clp protease proteolytic subunit [uncultured Pleomorphomonas sp.]|uniref:ATP-dependent Clp protease proteolytic subunit n=1 Tax=uncultured Pleomorphomonas sp. TaxID=442121 RepID=A0A212L764_9HYPH|nr:head maturation protease, ClpP-related [uncultured Pleomorphomonas sp.]SCM73391.1 ATP-dependent Clp protease proteolytic subunit [uncultured Pleomorphomonas sp.]